MKKLLAILTVIAIAVGSLWASDFKAESLTYKVKYKWGLVNKHAGTVTLSITPGTDGYKARLVAASQPWADKFFKVRDTLNARFTRNISPIFYEKIANEGGERKHDVVNFTKTASGYTGKCTRKVWKKGELKTDESRTLTASGTTVDMMTAYYYMRTLPYQTWKSGHTVKVNIFSGKRKELLTIVYHGTERVKTEKHEFDCYHITFEFTSDGGKKTSDDMDAWITTDSRRIPVRLEGNLPVGKVHCIYTGD